MTPMLELRVLAMGACCGGRKHKGQGLRMALLSYAKVASTSEICESPLVGCHPQAVQNTFAELFELHGHFVCGNSVSRYGWTHGDSVGNGNRYERKITF